jgi:hypothetical protein
LSRRIAFLAAAATAALGVSATPALAAPTADTTVTFAISAGGLNITAPMAINLGNTVTGGTVNGTIGPVVVADTRGQLAATWTAKVSATPFKTGGGSTAEIIPTSDVLYTPGLGTIVSGVPVPVPGTPINLTATPQTVMTTTAVGANSVSWNPTLSITIPAAAVAGTYTATVTHSVA